MDGIAVESGPSLSDDELDALFASAWPACEAVACDGGRLGFVLDTTAAPDLRRRGSGSALLAAAVRASRERGLESLHVDFVPGSGAPKRDCCVCVDARE